MIWTTDIYRKMAAALWGAVSLAIGLSIGFYFEMSEKKILFVVVVAVGLYVIALSRWFKKGEGGEDKVERGGSDTSFKQQSDEQLDYWSEEKQQHKPVREMNVGGDKRVDGEPREWLDDFLIKQQKD